jgi:hypothetical protein
MTDGTTNICSIIVDVHSDQALPHVNTFDGLWCNSSSSCTDVSLVVLPGPSVTTPQCGSVSTPCTAWAWVTPTTSGSGLSTVPGSADRPASLTRWLPWTQLSERDCKVHNHTQTHDVYLRVHTQRTSFVFMFLGEISDSRCTFVSHVTFLVCPLLKQWLNWMGNMK